MSKETGLILLGIGIAVLPYLGIPSAWKAPLFLLAGIAVILAGFLLRGAALSHGTDGSESHPFVESTRERGEA
jgi:uncharacterized membrane protein YccC